MGVGTVGSLKGPGQKIWTDQKPLERRTKKKNQRGGRGSNSSMKKCTRRFRSKLARSPQVRGQWRTGKREGSCLPAGKGRRDERKKGLANLFVPHAKKKRIGESGGGREGRKKAGKPRNPEGRGTEVLLGGTHNGLSRGKCLIKKGPVVTGASHRKTRDGRTEFHISLGRARQKKGGQCGPADAISEVKRKWGTSHNQLCHWRQR